MNTIIEPDADFQFSGLSLGLPTTMGGSFFSRIFNKNKNLYIQTPKSLTKQGFVKSGKKMFCDLMFDINDTMFISWIEKLETTCCNLIYEKSEVWFDNKMEIGDIESVFTSPLKTYKSGKYYLIRTNINNNGNIKIYNENNDILTKEQITNETHIVSILEIRGIKFTNKYFQIEIELKQAMVVSPDPFLDSCFIKRPNSSLVSSSTSTSSSTSSTQQSPISTTSFTDTKTITSPSTNQELNISSSLPPETINHAETQQKQKDEELYMIDDIKINIQDENEIKEIEKILENIENEKVENEKKNKNQKQEENTPKIKFLNTVETLNINNEVKEEELKTNSQTSSFLTNQNEDDYSEDDIIIHNDEILNDDIDIGIVDCFIDNDESEIKKKLETENANKISTEELEYYKKYKEAKDKAKELKETTKTALMELKKLKEKYGIKTNEKDDEEEKDLLVF